MDETTLIVGYFTNCWGSRYLSLSHYCQPPWISVDPRSPLWPLLTLQGSFVNKVRRVREALLGPTVVCSAPVTKWPTSTPGCESVLSLWCSLSLVAVVVLRNRCSVRLPNSSNGFKVSELVLCVYMCVMRLDRNVYVHERAIVLAVRSGVFSSFEVTFFLPIYMPICVLVGVFVSIISLLDLFWPFTILQGSIHMDKPICVLFDLIAFI